MNWRTSEYMGGMYELSECGLVRTKSNLKLRKPYKNKRNKYHYVTYGVNGKFYCKRLHRLIAICFLPNPDNLSDVNHIDGNKDNNCVSNLEWCSRRDNIHHYYKNHFKFKDGRQYDPLRTRRNPISKPGESKRGVIMTNISTGKSEHYKTACLIAKKFNMQAAEISRCCTGKIKKYRGFYFKHKKKTVIPV